MYSMFRSFLALVGLLIPLTQAESALVFTVTPLASTVAPNQEIVFDLFIESNSGPVTIDAIDVNAVAGSGDGTQGVFTEGLTLLLGGDPFDVTTTPGQAFSTNFQAGGVSINSRVQYGTLRLSTLVANPGSYNLSLDSLAANVPGVGAIEVTFDEIVFYTILPEPSSFGLVGLAAFSLQIRRRNCSRKTVRS